MPALAAPARWDAHYHVLKRFQQIHPALAEMRRKELGHASQAEYDEERLAVSGAYPHVRPLCSLLGVLVRCTQEMQAAKQVTLSRAPGMVGRLLHATSAEAREGAHESIKQIMTQLHAAVEKRLLGPAKDALVRSASFLDPAQFRATFKRDASDSFDPETTREVSKHIKDTILLVGGVFARQSSSATGSSQHDDDDSISIFADEMDGWGSKKMLRTLRKCRDTDKSDAADPLDWWRAHATQLQPRRQSRNAPSRLPGGSTECTSSRCSPVSCDAMPLHPTGMAHLHAAELPQLRRVQAIDTRAMGTSSHC